MLRRLLLLAAALANIRFTSAVYADDAWKLDYHHALLGLPRQETTFFHQPKTLSKASLLYTLSERNVLGAVNPRDGTLVWRQPLGDDGNATTTHLRGGQGQDIVVSLANDQLVAWTAQDGREAWRVDLHGAVLKDLEILEFHSSDVSVEYKDALVLTVEDGLSVVRRVNGATGQIAWVYKDRTMDVALQLSASNTDIYLVSLHSTMSSAYKIRATSLDLVSGRKTDQFTLDSKDDLAAVTDIVTVGANTASPIIAWTDKATSKLYINVIGTKTVKDFAIDQAQGSAHVVALHAPYHTNAQPHFLVHYQTETHHWADVYHVNLQTSTVSLAFSLPRIASRGAFAVTSIDANVFFTRITGSTVLVYSSTSASELISWSVAGLPDGERKLLDPVQLVSELNLKDGQVSAARCAVLLSSGDWLLLRNGRLVWNRHEGLAHTIAAAWVQPPADKTAIRELEEEAHSTIVHAYVHRLKRHVRDLQYLPQLLGGIPTRFLASIRSWDATGTEEMFGYRKLLVCITSKGRAIALDSVHGVVPWNVALRNVETVPGSVPLVTTDEDGFLLLRYPKGVTVRLNAMNGQQMIGGVIPEDASMQIDFDHRHVFATPAGPGQSAGATAWRFVANEQERIISVTHRPMVDPVASIGKVLGDRHVMYKYLNPNLIMVSTHSVNDDRLGVHLIDGATGTVLKTFTHTGANPGERLVATMSENWFAYTFTSSGTDSKSRGSHLVVGELFESAVKNDRGPNVVNGSYDLWPHVVSQTYAIPEPISVMELTQTGQGITSKVLLGVLSESQALIAIPRVVLDPRRPIGRAATTVEMMEGLMQYGPVLDFDPRWYLSHRRSVVGLQNVTTSPAIVESTSLVFSYGLDVFGTRISPSGSFDVLGKDFNKLQMLATVVALGVVTLLVAPLVQRKQINAIWQL